MSKKIICSVALLIGAARAEAHDRWTKQDTALECGYIALETMDLLTTSVVAAQPRTNYEANPLLGPHPSHLEIDAFFAATTLAHVAIAYALPAKYRTAWQLVTIGAKGAMVGWNLHAGIQVALPW